jgi:hypothetical protein
MKPWRQGQLPSGQTAKVRPDYRVQSLRKGHDRQDSIELKTDRNDIQDERLSGSAQFQMGWQTSLPARDNLGCHGNVNTSALLELYVIAVFVR